MPTPSTKLFPYLLAAALGASVFTLQAQPAEISLFAGLSNYLGDLQQQPITAVNAGKVLGLSYRRPINSHFWVRVMAAKGSISASDANNTGALRQRNLSFKTSITDGYLAAEYRLFTPERSAIIPYLYAGAGFFHFNPYVYYGDKNEKVYLQPLGTEGQGLPEYPDRQFYKLTQFFVPLGAGIQWHVNEKWILGIEFRQNFTFTDYLDDASNRYALQEPLLRDRGQLAVDLAWRRDEFDGRPYPTNEPRRGNPDNNDWYYYLGAQVGFRLPEPAGFGGGKKPKSQLGCPRW